MQIKALAHTLHTPLQNPCLKNPRKPSSFLPKTPPTFPPRLPVSSLSPLTLRISTTKAHSKRLIASCVGPSRELVKEESEEIVVEGGSNGALELSAEERESKVEVAVIGSKREELASKNIWTQMKEVLMFSGPATGLWICAPLMSLISTAVVGQGSSTELAALGSF